MLKLFNSFSYSKENFIPFQKDLVRIFICGPTVYDYAHLGHARIFLIYDLLTRYLHDQGMQTDILVNMTDINQNVFNKAKENSTTYQNISNFYASAFVNDLGALNIYSINRLAFASDYVESIEKEIKTLVQKQIAYVAHGNIYLNIAKVKNYGIISRQTKEQLSLHRLDVGPGKKNPEDIMLWNCIDDFDFSWNSELGEGIPWWHIQDTVVAIENFGKNYDIHGGARDLLYPHHEAHLAQYKILSDSETPVKIWMHIGLVLSNGEKMSKSIGNVFWIKDLIKKYGQNLIRLYIFSTPYRDDLNFSEKDILTKKSLLDLIQISKSQISNATDQDILNLIQDFMYSLSDDLDSPTALEKLEKICINVKNGMKINQIDFNRICEILGLKYD
jgi:cysteinyl-tRNA synthetase